MIRTKRVILITCLVLGCIVLLIISTILGLGHSAISGFNSRVAALKAAGEPTTALEIINDVPSTTESRNPLFDMGGDLDTILKSLGRFPSPDQIQINSYGKPLDQTILPGFLEKMEDALNKNKELFASLDSELKTHEVRAVVENSSDETACQKALSNSANSYSQILYKLGPLYFCRARIQIEQGNVQAALQYCLDLLRLLPNCRRLPFLELFNATLYTTRVMAPILGKIIQSGELSQEQHGEIEQLLAAREGTERYLWALRTERILIVHWIEMMRNELNPNPAEDWLVRVMFSHDLSTALDTCESQIAQVTAEDFVQKDLLREILQNRILPWLPMAPAADTIRSMEIAQSYRAALAAARSLRVINAIYAKHPDIDPAKLDLTKLGLPKEAHTDPYNRKPLTVEQRSQGWIVYSVGSNLKNDRGGQMDIVIGLLP